MAWQGQGGPEDAVGGIEATVSLDTSGIDPGLAGLQSKLNNLGDRLEVLGTRGATATTAIAAGMDRVGSTANAAGYKFQVFAQSLDDLQYIGEQGLRPILNNLIQISPVLGVAVLAADQFVKSMGGWKEVLSDLGVISPIETATEEMKRLGAETARTANEQDRLNRLKRGEAAVESIRTGESKGDKATAGAVQAAVDETDFRKVRDMVMKAQRADPLTAPKMSPEDAAALKRQKAFQEHPATWIPGGFLGYGLKEQIGQARNIVGGYGTDARKAIEDRQAREANAAAEKLIGEAKLPGAAGESARLQLEKYARKDPALGAFADKLKEAAPGAMQNAAIDKETNERLAAHRKLEKEYRGDLAAGSAADEEESRANFDKAMKKKLASGPVMANPLTAGERAAMTPEQLEDRRLKLRREGEELAQAGERRQDLNWRLRQLVKPNIQGQSMGLDAYESSIKSQTGDSEQVKRLHAIHEVLKDIKKNNERIKLIGVKKR